MKPILALVCASVAFCATDWPTGNRTTPPTINSVAPLGVARGATVELTVEGLNLANATAVFFDEPGIKARILRVKELADLPDIRLGSNGTASTVDLGPLPPRNQVTLELDVSPEAEIGPVAFRIQTPVGTSPVGRFLVEPYYGESPDREPNDTPEEAFESYLPTILVGTISKPGDFDYYKVKVRAGEELVFENEAAALGSKLQPVIAIYDEKQTLLKEYGKEGGEQAKHCAHRFDKEGAYYIRIGDYESGGSARHFYRIKVGKLPLAISAYPLGVQTGKTEPVMLQGYNLAAAKVEVKGEPSPEDEHAVIFRPRAKSGLAFNKVTLALGSEPETEAAGSNTSVASAQPLTIPVTVNGRMKAGENDFRFHARKGQQLVFDVAAARLGSPLDSMLEIVDVKGKPVERATIRCVLETSVTLRDHDSALPGIRLQASTGLGVGDAVMIGSELIQIDAMPRGPDDDTRFTSFDNRRITLLDTTPEAHALDQPAYKVQIHPPGAHFAPNGLPVVHLPYRNDDGGPGYGKDSHLRFTAPADGDYIVRLRDVRGLQGEEYAYRLTARPPSPDFELSVTPRNPNVPLGGRIPVTITALRMDEFDGPIDVEIQNLPAGVTATSGTIAAGQVATTLVLGVADDAKVDAAVPLKVIGKAKAGDRVLAHQANPEDRLKLIALVPKPDILMSAKARQVELEPGGTVELEVAITRNNGFGGRVPVEVRNLPPGVLVNDVGLNGVLINENEDRRRFVLQALPNAAPITQPIYISGKIETRADLQQTSFASEPVVLRIKPASQASAGRPAAAGASAKQ